VSRCWFVFDSDLLIEIGDHLEKRRKEPVESRVRPGKHLKGVSVCLDLAIRVPAALLPMPASMMPKLVIEGGLGDQLCEPSWAPM
jgi:hypothetical protein